jgi:dynein heavy chain
LELFNAEPEESAEKCRVAIKVCTSFKTTYYEYKAKIAGHARPWNFDSKLVFNRFDQFLIRVNQILELFETIIEFNRLEKVEVGGTKVNPVASQLSLWKLKHF